MKFRVPDWLIYGLIVLLIYLNATRAVQNEPNQPPPPEKLGELLPRESPRDPAVLVDIDDPAPGIGTAFVIDEAGTWMTARHVVDSCDDVALRIGERGGVKIDVEVSPDSDAAILKADWKRRPLPMDLETHRQVGEYGYFFGFPQGKPGEAVGALLGRHKMIVRGRYDTQEAVLAWTEVGRSAGLNGSLGGMSGAPALDKDGEVIGIVAAESPRRGRIYTVAPKNLRKYASTQNIAAEPINLDKYGSDADDYRRDRRIVQVVCMVR
ncbi:MAG: trypsin-like peptidase domain-containing protein [Hellea sp.]|nr:trypsin-like peptidase domain-containing protein [Hellea sp.]